MEFACLGARRFQRRCNFYHDFEKVTEVWFPVLHFTVLRFLDYGLGVATFVNHLLSTTSQFTLAIRNHSFKTVAIKKQDTHSHQQSL